MFTRSSTRRRRASNAGRVALIFATFLTAAVSCAPTAAFAAPGDAVDDETTIYSNSDGQFGTNTYDVGINDLPQAGFVTAITETSNLGISATPTGGFIGTISTVQFDSPTETSTATFEYTTCRNRDRWTYVGTDCDTATLTVNFIKAPTVPTAANNDVASTPALTPVTVAVLTNDVPSVVRLVSGTFGPDAVSNVRLADTSGVGTVTLNADQTVTFSPTLAAVNKAITIVYSVVDSNGSRASGTLTVNVGDLPPVAGDDAVTVTHGHPTTVDVLTNDTYTGNVTVQTEWSGSTAASSAGITVNADNTLTFQHARLDPRWSYAVGHSVAPGEALYRICDDFGCAVATVKVTTVAAATVVDDEVTLEANSTVTIDPLANDSSTFDLTAGPLMWGGEVLQPIELYPANDKVTVELLEDGKLRVTAGTVLEPYAGGALVSVCHGGIEGSCYSSALYVNVNRVPVEYGQFTAKGDSFERTLDFPGARTYYPLLNDTFDGSSDLPEYSLEILDWEDLNADQNLAIPDALSSAEVVEGGGIRVALAGPLSFLSIRYRVCALTTTDPYHMGETFTFGCAFGLMNVSAAPVAPVLTDDVITVDTTEAGTDFGHVLDVLTNDDSQGLPIQVRRIVSTGTGWPQGVREHYGEAMLQSGPHPGTNTIVYEACTAWGCDTATAVIHVTGPLPPAVVGEEPPTAVDDDFTIDLDGEAHTLPILANDDVAGAENAVVTIIDQSVPVEPAATTPAQLDSTLVLDAQNAGTGWVDYRLCTPGGCSTAHVTYQVLAGAAPQANDDTFNVTTETVTLDVLANDDLAGQAATSVRILGTLDWATVTGTDVTFTSPNAGVTNFTYEVCTLGGCSSADVTVTATEPTGPPTTDPEGPDPTDPETPTPTEPEVPGPNDPATPPAPGPEKPETGPTDPTDTGTPTSDENVDKPTGGKLPITGANSLTLAGIGSLVLLLGAAFVAAARRRRS